MVKLQNVKHHNKVTFSPLILNLPFLFFPLPKGMILPMEEWALFSAGLHSVTSQPGRGGPKSPALAWIGEQTSFRPPCAPDLCPSSLRSKHVTSRQGMWIQVTGTKEDSSSGTPCWLERQRCPLTIHPLPPVRRLGLRLVLCPTALALLLAPLSHWGQTRISALHKHPARLKLQWNLHRN